MIRKTNKRFKVITILLVLTMLISVGYALLSTTLTIDGTVNVAPTSWKIYFTNVQPTTGSVTPTTAPTVPEGSKDTTSLTWVVNLDEPGDFYEFTVDAVNEGTIDAMISTATANIVSQLTVDQRKYLDYTVTYSDGAPVEQYDKLAADSTETLRIRVEYKEDVNAADLPEEDKEITSFTYTADYIQADGNVKDREVVEQPVEPQLPTFTVYALFAETTDTFSYTTGMTWQQFLESEYNTNNSFSTFGDNRVAYNQYSIRLNNEFVNLSDEVQSVEYTYVDK